LKSNLNFNVLSTSDFIIIMKNVTFSNSKYSNLSLSKNVTNFPPQRKTKVFAKFKFTDKIMFWKKNQFGVFFKFFSMLGKYIFEIGAFSFLRSIKSAAANKKERKGCKCVPFVFWQVCFLEIVVRGWRREKRERGVCQNGEVCAQFLFSLFICGGKEQ